MTPNVAQEMLTKLNEWHRTTSDMPAANDAFVVASRWIGDADMPFIEMKTANTYSATSPSELLSALAINGFMGGGRNPEYWLEPMHYFEDGRVLLRDRMHDFFSRGNRQI